uniref:Uncharacterized protein n=1 Tax=Arundo donax TaxID=35708 RepID=A0A0A9BXY8_ARUDO
MCRHKPCSHLIFHSSPGNYRWFTTFFSLIQNLLPPMQSIVIKFNRGHLKLLFFRKIVHAKYLIALHFPSEIIFWVSTSSEFWHGNLELA